MNAKHFLLIIMSVLIICIGADKAALAEYVFLKDGAIVQGTVIVNRAASITIRKTNNEKLVIDKQKVLRILFSMKPLARVYLQKKDGKGFEAYIVDEDRNHYTLREDLYRPVEFKVNRNDVLFISDKNPSVLQGVPKEKQIVLSWYAPINHVKEYRIYLRQNQRAKYQLIGTSNINSYLVRGLKSKTTYYLKVTAVDDNNVESIPSNECMVTTKNIPPQKPAGLTIRSIITKNNVLTIQLNWEKATDADGSVTQYTIYEKKRQGYVKTGRTASLNYAVNGLDPGPNSTYHFAVRAVDDTGSESADAFVSSRVKNDLNISITGDYIVPLAQMGNLLTRGEGISVSVNRDDFLVDYLNGGFNCGFYMFDKKRAGVKDVYIVQLTASLGYRYYFNNSVSVLPYFAAGYSRISITYDKASGQESASGFDPTFQAGASLRYDINSRFSFLFSVDYTYMFEQADDMQFVKFTAGGMYRF